MSGTNVQASDYTVPTGILGLKGPVAKPAPGTLPLRGDLAHIALAETHLAAHYVIPHIATVSAESAEMRELARDDAESTTVLEQGQRIEVLDIGHEWLWCCLGPQGPSGYVHTASVEFDTD